MKNDNEHKKIHSKRTLSRKAADRVSRIIGSWTFVLLQTIFVLVWIFLNAVSFYEGWDPYPFIFLNLALSIIATYSAPVILMSQNRDAERDRIRAINDLATDRKAEREIQEIQKGINRIEKKIDKIKL